MQTICTLIVSVSLEWAWPTQIPTKQVRTPLGGDEPPRNKQTKNALKNRPKNNKTQWKKKYNSRSKLRQKWHQTKHTYNAGVIKKSCNTKYKELIPAMKDQKKHIRYPKFHTRNKIEENITYMK